MEKFRLDAKISLVTGGVDVLVNNAGGTRRADRPNR